MKSVTVTKKDRNLTGEVRLPSSKSISNRLLIIRSLSDQWFGIENLSTSDDTVLLANLLHKIRLHEGNQAMVELDTANAGTIMRFLTAYLSMVPGKWMLTGSERMKQRPIGILVDGLKSMGAKIDYLARLGYPPLLIHGEPLKGKEVIVDPGISSQFVSALIMLGPRIPGGIVLHLSGQAVSYPYIRMTISMLKDFGINVIQERSRIIIPEANYHVHDCSVEADWSAAAFWYEACALAETAEIELKDLLPDSLQGDSVVSEIFRTFNVTTDFISGGIRIKKLKSVNKGGGFSYNFSDNPDIAPPVITTSAMLGYHGVFTGLKSLQIKETDRLIALQTEFGKLGIKAETYSTGHLIPALEIPSGSIDCEPGLSFETYGDHRMAMTFAPLVMLSGEVRIEEPFVVSKSYPDFWNDLMKVGCGIEFAD